ncbi:hypothetical protein SGPA1_50606 [Streptomyces misionensis JCM 4497]
MGIRDMDAPGTTFAAPLQAETEGTGHPQKAQARKTSDLGLGLGGAPCRIRTDDLRFTRAAL